MKHYLADDDTRRYRSTETVGKFAAFQLPGMAAWRHTSEQRQHVEQPMTAVRLDVFSRPVPNVEVLPLMAIENDWLDAPGPPITVRPAGRI